MLLLLLPIEVKVSILALLARLNSLVAVEAALLLALLAAIERILEASVLIVGHSILVVGEPILVVWHSLVLSVLALLSIVEHGVVVSIAVVHVVPVVTVGAELAVSDLVGQLREHVEQDANAHPRNVQAHLVQETGLAEGAHTHHAKNEDYCKCFVHFDIGVLLFSWCLLIMKLI